MAVTAFSPRDCIPVVTGVTHHHDYLFRERFKSIATISYRGYDFRCRPLTYTNALWRAPEWELPDGMESLMGEFFVD